MSYKILSIPQFDKDVKKLAKKYRSIKNDILNLAKLLEDNPTMGDEVIKNCYKIRMAITSKGKGKSDGARVVTYIHLQQENIYLLSIYDKSQKENILDNEIKDLLKQIK